MNKELLEKAFNAGINEGHFGITFNQWFKKEIATDEYISSKLRKTYKLCSQKFFGVSPEKLFKSQVQYYTELRHIIRGIFLETFENLSYVGLARMEKDIALLQEAPNHATIIHSKNKYHEEFKNSTDIAHKELILTINNILDE